MKQLQFQRRLTLIAGTTFVLIALLACTGGGLTAARMPRWACPSPTPLPFGEGGPLKREWQDCTTDPITGMQTCETRREYYAEWEQEYPNLGGPPFPSPTPDAMYGTSYAFGQRVEVWPLHVLVSALDGLVLSLPGAAEPQQLFTVQITWLNHTTEAIAMDYATRVRLRSITRPDGRIISGATWGTTASALAAAGASALPKTIPPGESRVSVPILGPVGSAKTVEIAFHADAAYRPAIPTATTLAGTATPTAVATIARTTPTPNSGLQNADAQDVLVQWSNVTLRDRSCGSPGALTGWGDTENPGALVAPAPEGTNRLLQVALNQVGKPYVWGAKGPERFDCSGLTQWSYGQIGIRIPAGTAGQWPQMRAVEAAALQPGDLIFFAIAGGGIDHVGLLGDFNGDGRWDLLHAASPQLGVRIDYSVFQSAYYGPRIRSFRTAR